MKGDFGRLDIIPICDLYCPSPDAHVEHDGGFVVLGMRLRIACAAMRRIINGNTLNLPVVAQQPHLDPNYAPHIAARRVRCLEDQPWHGIVSMSGAS